MRVEYFLKMIIMICSSTIQIVSTLNFYATEINRCTSHMLSRGARFKKNARGAKGWLKSRMHIREYGMPGRGIPNLRKSKYWTLHPLSSVMKLEPGEVGSFAISFIRLQAIQKERKELGIFDLDAPLSFYALDVSGKKYEIHSGATPNSFLEEATAKMTRVSPLTGEPIRDNVK